MAKAKRRAPGRPAGRGRGRRGRPRNDGPAYDVLGLRKKIGAAHGVAQVSRETLAKLLGAAVGSIVNWERGMAPRPQYLEKLRDIEKQVAAGSLHINLPRRGRQPRGGAAASAPSASAAGASRGRRAAALAASGTAPVIYANQVVVESGTHDARIRFALVMPGQRDVRAVADVIVPREVIDSLR